jgi:hypothetical protein
MREHLYMKKKPCPKIINNIELTDEIKQFILDNRVYNLNKPKSSAKKNIYEEVANLRIENDILKNKKNEDFYQAIVEKYLNGKHSRNIHGITDVTNDYVHAEIKTLCDYKHAVGQLFAYNKVDPRKELHIYLFDDKNKKQLLIAAEYLKSLDIKVFTFNVTREKVEIIEYETNEIKFTHIV